MGRTQRSRAKKKRKQADSFATDLSVHDLYIWMKKKGFVMKMMKPAVFDDTGRGLKAYEKILAGDLLISVPLSNLITCQTVLQSYLQKPLLKHYVHLSAIGILSVFLMCEKLQGSSSDWSHYINYLPSQYTLPAYFPQDCLKFLPIIVKNDVEKQIFTLEKIYSSLKTALNDIEKHFPQFCGFLNFELFKWAWTSVNTRCVYMKCEKIDCDTFQCKNHLALAPFLDLLNHSPSVQVTAGFNTETNCYEIVHQNNIQKYEQVFINYGPHTNHKLFLEYGFVVPNNANDLVQFNWDSILEASSLLNTGGNDLCIREKVIFLNQFRLIRNIGCDEGGLTWNFEMILKVLSSKKHKSNQLQSLLSDMNSLDAEENNTYRRLLCHLLNLKIKEFSLPYHDVKRTQLTCFSLACLQLTKQFCIENRKLLLKCLNVYNIQLGKE